MTKTITNGLAAAIVATVCFCGSTEAAVVASPRIVDISPDAPAGSAVTLTNIFKNLANNTTYRLLPGTNSVSTYPYHALPLVDIPHLFIRDKTNITIEGMGWNSVISTPHTGTVFSVFNCQNIVFKNFAVIGTRVPNGGDLAVDTIAAFVLHGTNGGLVWDSMLVENHTIDGIRCLFANNTNTLLVNSTFRKLGHTNYIKSGVPSADGAALNGPGSDLRAMGNRFEECLNGLELFAANGAATASGGVLRNIIADDNQFVRLWANSIYHCCTGPTIGNMCENFTYSNNTIEYDRESAWGAWAAFRIAFGRNGIFANNTIKNAPNGFVIQSLDASILIENIVIANNDLVATSGAAAGGHGIAVFLNGDPGKIRNITVAQNTSDYSSEAFVHAVGNVTHSYILNNTVLHAATNNPFGAAAMWFRAGCLSNTIAGNRFYNFGGVVATRPQWALRIESGVNFNVFKDNDIDEFTTAAWTDSGAQNEFRNNWIGTNLAIRGFVIDRQFTTNIAGAVSIGAPQSNKIILTSTGAHTLANPNVADGLYDGQEVTIRMEGANTVIFTDGSNVELNAATITLSDRDALVLQYDAADSLWYLVQHMNNL